MLERVKRKIDELWRPRTEIGRRVKDIVLRRRRLFR